MFAFFPLFQEMIGGIRSLTEVMHVQYTKSYIENLSMYDDVCYTLTASGYSIQKYTIASNISLRMYVLRLIT